MRTARTNLRGLRRTSHTVNVALLVAVIAFSPLIFTNRQLHALPDDANGAADADPETAAAKPSEDEAAIRAPLQPGTPTTTTAAFINHTRTKLTWNPTGLNDVEDTYDVLITSSGDADGVGKLTGEPLLPGNDLTVSEFDISPLAEGTYYWQVRSCVVGEACNNWSPAQPVTLDIASPGAPTVSVTSGAYDRMVVTSGMAEVSSAVTVTAGKYVCQTTASTDGSWTCAFDQKFDYGKYDANVITRDAAGNESTPLSFALAVKELFVAKPIVTEELPPVLDIVPVKANPENKVFQQPVSTIDTVNMGVENETKQTVLGVGSHLSTDGGVVQSSANGWQVFGMPWFVWIGSLGSAFAGWWALGWPVPRRLLSL